MANSLLYIAGPFRYLHPAFCHGGVTGGSIFCILCLGLSSSDTFSLAFTEMKCTEYQSQHRSNPPYNDFHRGHGC
ncbi:hypothetical protein GIJ50_23050 [Klebsiella oxytoca]|nr:hypothetical protein [Klebsiella oxytoca]MRG42646.1 hypothetical protein [Klebsiella oxytoca]